MADAQGSETVDGVEPSILVKFIDGGGSIGQVNFGGGRTISRNETKLLTPDEYANAIHAGAELKVIDSAPATEEPEKPVETVQPFPPSTLPAESTGFTQ